ncbi:hypothetical protein ACFLS1_05645 [Verrucomicrobiota bacterium]
MLSKLLLVLVASGLLFTVGCEKDDDDDDDNAAAVTEAAETAVELTAPTLLSPGNEQVFTHSPRTLTLTWEAVDGAVSYDVEIDKSDIGGWFEFIRTNVAETSYAFDFVSLGEGRWRVRAKDSDGNEGPFSAWRTFTFTIVLIPL